MKFSYQLYSSRNAPPLIETLRMLKAAGYSEVEGYGGVVRSGDAGRRWAAGRPGRFREEAE